MMSVDTPLLPQFRRPAAAAAEESPRRSNQRRKIRRAGRLLTKKPQQQKRQQTSQHELRVQQLHVQLAQQTHRLEGLSVADETFGRALGIDPKDQQAMRLAVAVHGRGSRQYKSRITRQAEAALLARDSSAAGQESVRAAAMVAAGPEEIGSWEAGMRLLSGEDPESWVDLHEASAVGRQLREREAEESLQLAAQVAVATVEEGETTEEKQAQTEARTKLAAAAQQERRDKADEVCPLS